MCSQLIQVPPQTAFNALLDAGDSEPATLGKGRRLETHAESPEIVGSASIQRIFVAKTHGAFEFSIVHTAPVIKNRDPAIHSIPSEINVNFFGSR